MVELSTACLLLLFVPGAGSFVLPSVPLIRSRSALCAKTKKATKQKSRVVASGGFGRSNDSASATAHKENDDYAAFPALEKSVQDTLVAAPPDGATQPSDLSMEMYQRLGEIYGFKSFNYLLEEGSDEVSSVSFGDLLSAPVEPSPSPAPLSDFGDLIKPSTGGSDFADLIASATGGGVKNSSPPVGGGGGGGKPSIDMKIDNLPAFEKFRVLHVDPMVLCIDDFFTPEECDKYIAASENPSKGPDSPMQSRSKTVGKDALAKAQRTSTTWFHHYKTVPELMAKASRLLGLDGIDQWEEPQTVRYRRNEKFTWHLDALAPSERLAEAGGQRLATLLVYLTDLTEEEGGATMFRDLGGPDGPLRVRPQKGSALLFFPAAGGVPNVPFDIRTLHCGEAVAGDAGEDKWISQLWLRQQKYTPTAPAGNSHGAAAEAIASYCLGHHE